jgi:hypothetical protein
MERDTEQLQTVLILAMQWKFSIERVRGRVGSIPVYSTTCMP